MLTYDYVVVGAGITGLTLARRLQEHHQRVLLLEKSRGAGGRLCTRRWDDSSGVFFDHGCAGFPDSSKVRDWIREFKLESLFFNYGKGFEFSGFENRLFLQGGASKLGRAMSEGLELHRQVKVDSVEVFDGAYKLTGTEGEIFLGNRIIVTAPLPQAKELLAGYLCIDGIPDIKYQKRICLLASVSSLGPLQDQLKLETEGHTVLNMGLRHSISTPAVMLVSSSAWAEERYEDEQKQLLVSLKTTLEQNGIGPVSRTQVHKWRYAISDTGQTSGFCRLMNDSVYVCGEAFSGGGVEAAILSANKLSRFLF